MTSKWYILTLPKSISPDVFPPADLPLGVDFMCGQLECGVGGLLHYQFVLHYRTSVRSSAVRRMFVGAHVEATRSAAAVEYCQKADTRVDGTQFELGIRPVQRNQSKDWDLIWSQAKAGKITEIPADIRIRCYSTLTRIQKDYCSPQPIERQIVVLYGATGTGKSRRAWLEASFAAFPKDPNTKFWDGYRDHEHVVIDEFRGSISISHILRWFDRYPCIIEIKGGAVCLSARKIWVTSNRPPSEWYPELDSPTYEALCRRLTQFRFESDGKVFDGEGNRATSYETFEEENVVAIN